MGRNNSSQMEIDNEQILNNQSQSLENEKKINNQSQNLEDYQNIQSGSGTQSNYDENGSIIQSFHCSIKSCKSYFISQEDLLDHMKVREGSKMIFKLYYFFYFFILFLLEK